MSRFSPYHTGIVLYGAALAALLFLLKWLEISLIIIDDAVDIYIGCIAILFTALGIWLATKFIRPRIKTVIADTNFSFNNKEMNRLGLRKRELEVLQLMAEGLSNQEIGSRLFVSVNTIKTHSSHIFEKLDVRRRTQAIEKARQLGLLPYSAAVLV